MRDAMPTGGRLETSNDDEYAARHHEVEAGQYVVLTVTDTGSGMTQAVAERAFDPFFTTKGLAGGTGLGLSQVYGFVKQSGGHVKIYSEVAHGTALKIYLRRSVAKAAGAEPRKVEVSPSGTVDELVLVVEDEAAVRRYTVDALRELGYTVRHRISGRVKHFKVRLIEASYISKLPSGHAGHHRRSTGAESQKSAGRLKGGTIYDWK